MTDQLIGIDQPYRTPGVLLDLDSATMGTGSWSTGTCLIGLEWIFRPAGKKKPSYFRFQIVKSILDVGEFANWTQEDMIIEVGETEGHLWRPMLTIPVAANFPTFYMESDVMGRMQARAYFKV